MIFNGTMAFCSPLTDSDKDDDDDDDNDGNRSNNGLVSGFGIGILDDLDLALDLSFCESLVATTDAIIVRVFWFVVALLVLFVIAVLVSMSFVITLPGLLRSVR